MKLFRILYSISILLFLFPLNIYANNNDFCPLCGWPHMMTWGWGGMLMILLFLLFIGLVVYLVMKSTKTTPTEYFSKESKPLDILKERYARGEITKEEYDKMKKDLQD